MAYKNTWEFKKDEMVKDLVSNKSAKVLVLNSNNSKIERRFYIEVLGEDLVPDYYWRTANQLGRA
jgi:hypothetical protein